MSELKLTKEILIEFEYDRYGEKYVVKDVTIEYYINSLSPREQLRMLELISLRFGLESLF